jgi:drug/metabolite transporter (DMT)-like permease
MRGLIVLVTAAMSMIFLGKKQYRHHYLSLLTIVLGIVLVGYASLAKENTSDGT